MNKLNRRNFLKGAALAAGGAMLAACAPAQTGTPETVKQTVIVEKQVQQKETVVVEKIVTATPAKVDWLHADDISAMPSTAIRYWYYESPERTELGQKQVEEFQKLFPNIKVLGRQAPRWTDNQALLAYIKAGTDSHIQQSVNNEDLWYIDHGIPLEADELPGFQELFATLSPKMNYQWKGKTWSLPWYWDGMALVYNKKMVVTAGLDPTNPPKTYSELMAWAKALTIPGKQWFAAPTQGEEWWWWEFVVQPFYIAATGSSDLLNKDTQKPIFNNEQYGKVLQMWQDLFTKGYASLETFQTSPFLGGQIACEFPAWLGNHKGYKRDAPKGFEYIVGPIPKPDDSPVAGNKTFLFVRNLMLIKEIQKTGEEADRIMRAAWEFMRYLLSPAQAAADFEVSGNPPSQADYLTNTMYANLSADLGPEFQWHAKYVLDEGMLGDLTNVKTVDYEDFQQKLYLNVIRNKMTPAEGMKWAEDQTVQLLAQK